MKLLLTILTAVALTSGAIYLMKSDQKSYTSSRLMVQDVPTPIWDAFKHWQQKYGKAYGTNNEEGYRAGVFQTNMKKVYANNGDKNATSKMDLNVFADLTTEEFLAKYTGLSDAKNHQSNNFEVVKQQYATVQSSDWRLTGVTRVKNQGHCGSCWAFSTIGAVEGLNMIMNGGKKEYSEQQLVDCSTANNGCSGGLMPMAFEYLKTCGLVGEDDYPYRGIQGQCQNKDCHGDRIVKSWAATTVGSADSLASALMNQPVSVAVDASAFQLYHSGVFTQSANCAGQLNHGVLAVGYDATEKWFRIKNSWGDAWGEAGYIRLQRLDDNRGMCGVFENCSYPLDM